MFIHTFIGQNLLTIKQSEVDGKICYIYNPLLEHTKHLGKIKRLGYKQFLYFLLYVNSFKKFFMSKTKFNCVYKMSIFSYSQLPKILKLWRSSLRLVFLIKIVYNQFLLLKNFTSSVSFDLFPLIWNLLYFIRPKSHKFLIRMESFEI